MSEDQSKSTTLESKYTTSSSLPHFLTDIYTRPHNATTSYIDRSREFKTITTPSIPSSFVYTPPTDLSYMQQNAILRDEYEKLRIKYNTLVESYNMSIIAKNRDSEYKQQIYTLTEENKLMKQQIIDLEIRIRIKQLEEALPSYPDLKSKHEEIQQDRTDLEAKHEEIQQGHTYLEARYEEIKQSHMDLETKYEEMLQDYTYLKARYEDIKQSHTDLKIKHDEDIINLQAKFEQLEVLIVDLRNGNIYESDMYHDYCSQKTKEREQ